LSEQSKTQLIYCYVVRRIEQLDKDSPWAKTKLAKLRHAAGKEPGDSPGIWDVTMGDMPDELSGRGEYVSYPEHAIHIALTLYALHKQGKADTMHEKKGLRLGGGAARLINDRNKEGIQRRFNAVVTAQNLSELSNYTRGLIQMMRSLDIPIKLDYGQLAVDLFYYQIPAQRNKVRLQWGREFYRCHSEHENPKENNNNEQNVY